MITDCYLESEDNKVLDQDAVVTTLDSNAIRKINGRKEEEEVVVQLRTKDIIEQGGNKKEDPTTKSDKEERIIKVSSNILAQMIFHPISSEAKLIGNPMLTVDRKDNVIKITDNDKMEQNWANSEQGGKIKEMHQLGRYSEEAITKQGDGVSYVTKQFNLNFNQAKITKQIDAFQIEKTEGEGHVIHLVEIKGRSQLGMAKPIFFQQRIVELVSKAFIARCPRCFIVVRDDLETTDKSIKAKEVLVWDNVLRLVPEIFIKEMSQFLTSALNRIFGKREDSSKDMFLTLKNIEIKEEGVHFAMKSEAPGLLTISPLILNGDKWYPKNNFAGKEKNEKRGSTKICKTMSNYIVVGQGIPPFAYNLDDVFLRFKYRKKWRIDDGCSRLILLTLKADVVKEIMALFQPFRDRKTPLTIVIIYYNSISKAEENVLKKMILKKQDNIKDVLFLPFSDTNDLGEKIYKLNLTLFRSPIPALLLLLGDKQRVPECLPIDRLSFVMLENADTFDFTLLNIPEIIVAIGNCEECKKAETLSILKFPKVKSFKAFVTDQTTDQGEAMKAHGIPMYNSFSLLDKRYVAK